MVEVERGCGWRKIGGVYVTADQGMSVACDSLPLELVPCPHCEYEIFQRRSMVPYPSGYLAGLLHDHKCKDNFLCPLCYFGESYRLAKQDNALNAQWNKDHPSEKQKPMIKIPKNFFVMWVSKQFYTTESFLKEAGKQGISKRIAANSLPTDFVVGRDWVFLAHGETLLKPIEVKQPDGSTKTERPRGKAIFYAFKPQRIEIVLWKGTPNETIQAYEDAGYFVVLLEKTKKNLERHGDGPLPPLPTGKGKAMRKTGKEKDGDESDGED